MPDVTLTTEQLLAGVNALHEAEHAKLPLSARVRAVAQALGYSPSSPTPVELALCVERLAAALERRLPTDAPIAETDQALLRQARQLIAPSSKDAAMVTL